MLTTVVPFYCAFVDWWFTFVDRQRGLVISSQLNLSERLHIEAPTFTSTGPLDTQKGQTNIMSRIPELIQSDLSHLCAKYLRAQFKYRLDVRSSGASAMLPDQPLILPVALASELDIIAAALVVAFFNRSQ